MKTLTLDTGTRVDVLHSTESPETLEPGWYHRPAGAPGLAALTGPFESENDAALDAGTEPDVSF